MFSSYSINDTLTNKRHFLVKVLSLLECNSFGCSNKFLKFRPVAMRVIVQTFAYEFIRHVKVCSAFIFGVTKNHSECGNACRE